MVTKVLYNTIIVAKVFCVVASLFLVVSRALLNGCGFVVGDC